MYLPNEFVIGFSFGVIGIVGMFSKMRYFISKYCGSGYSSDDDCYLQKKEDLEDDMDDKFFNAETGSELLRINVNKPNNILEILNKINEKTLFMEQKFKTLEKMYRDEKEKQSSRELQFHRFEERCLMNLPQTREVTDMHELFETVQKLQATVEKQQSIIKKKNNCDEESLKEKIKALKELYRNEEEKKASRKLQSYCFEECCSMSLKQICRVTDMRELSESVEKLQKTTEKQKFMIEKMNNNCDEELRSLKFDKTIIKNDLNTLIANINDLRTQMMFIERDIETPNSKFGKLKSKIGILEREVTKNSAHIIGMNCSYQTLLTRLNLGAAISLAENNFERSPPNASTSSLSFTTKGSASSRQVLNLPSSPPPITTIPAVFGPPSPPPPPPVLSIMPTTRCEVKETVTSPSQAVASDKITSTYFRIPITEEILKSVVLKPPGQRKVRKIFSTK